MKYRVVFSPEGGRWNVAVPKLRGCVTWGRSLSAARRHAREAIAAIAAAEGRDAAKVERETELEEVIALPARADKELREALGARDVADAAASRAAVATADAVRALAAAGLSVRDIGDLLGLSHQRIQQLKENTPTRRLAV